MKLKKVKKLYIRNIAELTFLQRLSYVSLNEFCIDFNKFKIPLNPLMWCLFHAIKIVWLPILCLLWILMLPTVMTYSAIKIKDRYSSHDYIGVYVEDAIILVFNDMEF